MIDNSASMADKQLLLAKAVPDFVSRLTSPPCVDASGQPSSTQPVFPAACPDGSQREFSSVQDLHLAVISSSLGGHGSPICELGGSGFNETQRQMSHLLSEGPSGPVPTYGNKGFLAWDPGQIKTPPGTSDAKVLGDAFSSIVQGVGQDGCGFESSLEAIYRFLVDPAPYAEIIPAPCSSTDTGNNCRAPQGVDSTVLTQRKEFLRPDSLVSIMMLTDEDDCSIVEGGQTYLLGKFKSGTADFHLPRATSACETDPNSVGCRSCGLGSDANDVNCKKGAYTESEDPSNLRCYRQKQRFGFDWLYPTQRYVDGFSQAKFADGTVNPLFCTAPSADKKSCTIALRDSSLVVLGGILGVPWQDIAVDPTNIAKGYKSNGQIDWDTVIGSPSTYKEPKDPLMIPSIKARTGINPATGSALAAAGGTNPINGSERQLDYLQDLQYACIFQLPTPRDCTVEICDCQSEAQNPLCRNPQNGTFETTKQFSAKAYPTLRQLEVIRGLGTQGVPASICAAETKDLGSSIYGYRPVADAMITRMKRNF